MLSDLNKLNKFIKDRNRFSSKTFGTLKQRGPTYPLRKMQEELVELLENPKDTSEWTDIMLCFFDAAWRAGFSFEDVLDFAIAKLEINKKRKWKHVNGNYRHI